MARVNLTEFPVILDERDKKVIDAAIRETCTFRSWEIHALSVRSNHVHLVVSGEGCNPEKILQDVKAYGSRALNAGHPSSSRKHWWTRGGSTRYLNDTKSQDAAVEYVLSQDMKEERFDPTL